MPDLLDMEDAAKLGNDVVRGNPLRFIHQEDPFGCVCLILRHIILREPLHLVRLHDFNFKLYHQIKNMLRIKHEHVYAVG